MNDFAKFIFCFSGFVGFLLFFLFGFLIHKDLFLSIFLGTCGCLLFALFGRILLGFVLRGIIIGPQDSTKIRNEGRKANEISTPNTSINSKVMNEAVTQSKLFVEEKA